MAVLSVPAVAQRGGGGAVPEGCAPQPEWQTKSLADYQAKLDQENPPAARGGGGGGGGGRGGRGGGGAAAAGAPPAGAAGAGGAAAAGGPGAGGPGGGGGRGAGGGGGRGGRGGGGAAAALPPVPRIPNEPQYGVQAGKPDFGGLAAGDWNVPYIINMQTSGRDEKGCPVIVPFKPEALALWEDRELGNKEAGDPESFCLPPGVPRMMYTPYPAQIYQMPDRIVMVFEGGAHVWRLIWMDGRKLPNVDDINPDYLGYSVGHWEGDTLVVEAVGFNHQTWLDASGHPHGEKMKVTEKYTRTNFNTLQYSATIDDPEYYTAPWTTVINNINWTANTHGPWSMRGGEIMEYICQENNRDLSHLGPKSQHVDTR